MKSSWLGAGAASRLVAGVVNLLTIVLLLLAGWRAVPAVTGAVARRDAAALAAVADGRPTVLVLFQTEDCSAAGQFVMDWRRLLAAREARVVAVPIDIRSREELVRVVGEFPAGIQVRSDLGKVGASLLRRFEAPYTPVAVLLDARGRPRMLIPEIEASRNQLAVQAAVSTYLSMRRRR